MGGLVTGSSALNTPPPSTASPSTPLMETPSTVQFSMAADKTVNTPSTGSSNNSATSGPSSGGDASRVLQFPQPLESSAASTMLPSAFPPLNAMMPEQTMMAANTFVNPLQLQFLPNLSLNTTNLQSELLSYASAGGMQHPAPPMVQSSFAPSSTAQ
eukprot:2683798-Rhodomonas_salina.1